MRLFEQNYNYGESFKIDIINLIYALDMLGNRDLNEPGNFIKALEQSYDDLFGEGEFNATYKIREINGSPCLIVDKLRDRGMLIDILRDMYEREMNCAVPSKVEDAIITIVKHAK